MVTYVVGLVGREIYRSEPMLDQAEDKIMLIFEALGRIFNGLALHLVLKCILSVVETSG